MISVVLRYTCTYCVSKTENNGWFLSFSDDDDEYDEGVLISMQPSDMRRVNVELSIYIFTVTSILCSTPWRLPVMISVQLYHYKQSLFYTLMISVHLYHYKQSLLQAVCSTPWLLPVTISVHLYRYKQFLFYTLTFTCDD